MPQGHLHFNLEDMDRANRKCTCRRCNRAIFKGEPRVGFPYSTGRYSQRGFLCLLCALDELEIVASQVAGWKKRMDTVVRRNNTFYVTKKMGAEAEQALEGMAKDMKLDEGEPA